MPRMIRFARLICEVSKIFLTDLLPFVYNLLNFSCVCKYYFVLLQSKIKTTNNMDNWKVKLVLDECAALEDLHFEERDMQFLPRVGEFIWPSRDCCAMMEAKVRECYAVRKCPECPYAYSGGRNISVDDDIYVRSVLHNVQDREVYVRIGQSFEED